MSENIGLPKNPIQTETSTYTPKPHPLKLQTMLFST